MKVDVYHLYDEGDSGLILVLVPEGKALPAAGLPDHARATCLGSFVLGETRRPGLNPAAAVREIDSRGFHVCPTGLGILECLRQERARGDRPIS